MVRWKGAREGGKAIDHGKKCTTLKLRDLLT